MLGPQLCLIAIETLLATALYFIPETLGVTGRLRFRLLLLAVSLNPIGDGWKRAANSYGVIVVDELSEPSHAADFATEPGSRIVYRDRLRTVVNRRGAAD